MKALKRQNSIYICGAVFGIFASLCIVTLGVYLSYAMSEPQISPIFYPIAAVVGALALIICLAAAIINGILFRRAEHKVKTILIEFAFIIAAYIVFIFIWGIAWQIICDMLTGTQV